MHSSSVVGMQSICIQTMCTCSALRTRFCAGLGFQPYSYNLGWPADGLPSILHFLAAALAQASRWVGQERAVIHPLEQRPRPQPPHRLLQRPTTSQDYLSADLNKSMDCCYKVELFLRSGPLQ